MAAGSGIQDLFDQMDLPIEEFDRAVLGDDFPEELKVVSRLWFKTGYGQGIAAYLNFFLLRDFIEMHDTAFPPRFASFKSMADSFYRTDLFVRDVTDSGKEPTGGISSEKVRKQLSGIMRRHDKVSIPHWIMTYFGFQLAEAVEVQCAPLTEDERQRHLAYMSKAYRIMGIPFSENRELMETFARKVEVHYAGESPNLEKHAHHILILGEMVGVSSQPESILGLLPDATARVFEPMAERVRPGVIRRVFSRTLGKMLMPRAVGEPRVAVPVEG